MYIHVSSTRHNRENARTCLVWLIACGNLYRFLVIDISFMSIDDSWEEGVLHRHFDKSAASHPLESRLDLRSQSRKVKNGLSSEEKQKRMYGVDCQGSDQFIIMKWVVECLIQFIGNDSCYINEGSTWSGGLKKIPYPLPNLPTDQMTGVEPLDTKKGRRKRQDTQIGIAGKAAHREVINKTLEGVSFHANLSTIYYYVHVTIPSFLTPTAVASVAIRLKAHKSW